MCQNSAVQARFGKPRGLWPAVVCFVAAAFSGCLLLERVTVSAGVTRIPDSAFADCDLLTDVSHQDGLKTIGSAQEAVYGRAYAACSTGFRSFAGRLGGIRRR
ncbi:MAG: leucine-rich repeat domain-containing protein [Treponema sp.]|nr:leucine-rich repeat domain-containing protein [Treponema sp.]